MIRWNDHVNEMLIEDERQVVTFLCNQETRSVGLEMELQQINNHYFDEPLPTGSGELQYSQDSARSSPASLLATQK